MLFLARNLGVTWDDLDKATYNLHDMLTRDPSLATHMLDADLSIKHIKIDMLAYPRKLFYFRYLVSRGHGGGGILGFPDFKIEKMSPGFLEVLVLARDFECTDPRDHIFALWNLAQDKEGLDYAPGYTESYEEVYTCFMKAWISQHKALDMLGAVELTHESSGFYTKAPSWCPNWNVPATASCLVRRDYLPNRSMSAMHDLSGKLYYADGGMTQDLFTAPLITLQGNELHATGLIIDQISHIFEDAPDIPAGTAPKSHWRAHYWGEAIRKYYLSHGLTTYDDPARAVWAMFHGDSVAAWPPVEESGYAPGQCRPSEHYACLPQLSRHVRKYADSYSRTEAWTAIDTVLRGRRPVFSDNGYIGLAPAYLAGASEAWSIAVVAGCSVPLILVEREDGTYQLVGTCFVQGWMDGEWVETMMGAESAKGMWEAMGDGARIVIT
jgi:hypothetical protein